MTYTKDYYRILGLEPPSLGSSNHLPSIETIKKAYRNALLSAHPDKAQALGAGARHKSADGKLNQKTYTIDDVKEAFEVLGDEKRAAQYHRWLAAQPVKRASGGLSADFVLGLELLDLSDFASVDEEGPDGMEWTRGCRCGADKGFRIREEDLEEVETRGEKEVLVGCEGCSLWVRVGFDVEEG
jgi:diphthamide biosynthesis protein 4